MFGDYAGGLCETAHQRVEDEAFYQKRAEQVMSDEHCFRIIIYKDEGKVTFEMLASNEEEESANEGDEESTSTQSSRTLRSSAKRGDKWNELGDAADIEGLAEKLDERLKEKPLFLRRCIRKYKSTTGDDNDTKDLSSSEKTASAEDDEKMSGDEKTPKDSTDLAKPEKSDSHAECELKLDSFRSVLVVTNDSILYRRNALTKARQVSFKRCLVFHKLTQVFTSLTRRYIKIYMTSLTSGTHLGLKPTALKSKCPSVNLGFYLLIRQIGIGIPKRSLTRLPHRSIQLQAKHLQVCANIRRKVTPMKANCPASQQVRLPPPQARHYTG